MFKKVCTVIGMTTIGAGIVSYVKYTHDVNKASDTILIKVLNDEELTDKEIAFMEKREELRRSVERFKRDIADLVGNVKDDDNDFNDELDDDDSNDLMDI